MLHNLVLNYVMPLSVVVVLFGSLTYCYLVNKVMWICREAYPRLVAMERHHYRTNLDQPFYAFTKVGPMLKAGEWKTMPSAGHRKLCVFTLWLGRVVGLGLLGLVLPLFI